MNNNRKTVKQNLGEQMQNLEGTIDYAIQYLVKIKEEYADRKNLRLVVDYDTEGNSLDLVYDREESDQEYNLRISDEKRREQFQRKQYEMLKAKFENQPTKK